VTLTSLTPDVPTQDKEAAGLIFAEDIRNVAPNDEESKKDARYSFCFEIETKERTYLVRQAIGHHLRAPGIGTPRLTSASFNFTQLNADSRQEMLEWVQFIRSVWEVGTQPSLEGRLQYATVESFMGQGLRVNGAVEPNALGRLSEGASQKQKRKDQRGW
jgi:hypothetical protein